MNSKRVKKTTVLVRITGIAYLIVIVWNFEWVMTNLNYESTFAQAASLMFLLATIITTISGLVLVWNNWNFSEVIPKKLKARDKPRVAVLIPTYKEPIEIVINTVRSVFNQDYPEAKILVVVSDDAHDQELQTAIMELEQEITGGHHSTQLIYHTPPRKNDPNRKGEAKAGNLNSAFRFVRSNFPEINYIETRDADDLVGTKLFLSYCLQTLESDRGVSFVQTIKKCRVSPGDPFSNQETAFYQNVMPTRLASNAVFPCGSGLVWRATELERIDGFPSWNLVEDLQSGYEILRKGGRGVYLPIVGALGQISPEDIPNFYKQRGTWALDTLRLFYWKNPLFEKGLTFRQRLQFFELEFSYLLSFAMAMFILSLFIALAFGVYPVLSSTTEYLTHIIIFTIVLEIYNVLRGRDVPYKDLWRTRQIWIGLVPLYIMASFKALKYGPHKKPTYQVTRKYHEVGWYWKEVLISKIIITVLLGSIIIALVNKENALAIEAGLIFWSLFFIDGFWRVVKNSWHGVPLDNPIPRLQKRALARISRVLPSNLL